MIRPSCQHSFDSTAPSAQHWVQALGKHQSILHSSSHKAQFHVSQTSILSRREAKQSRKPPTHSLTGKQRVAKALLPEVWIMSWTLGPPPRVGPPSNVLMQITIIISEYNHCNSGNNRSSWLQAAIPLQHCHQTAPAQHYKPHHGENQHPSWCHHLKHK